MPQIHYFMKRYIYLLITVLALTSCTEDVKFNTPAFQGLKNNVFWRAQGYKAYVRDNKSIIIEGNLGYEKVVLEAASSVKGTYILGINDASLATYSNTLASHSAVFSTDIEGGNGQIVITEYNEENKTISGTFKFIAVNQDTGDLENPKVSFTEGAFYKVPVAPIGILLF